MNVLVYADAHLYKTEDGRVWTKTIYGYEFWTRYLNVFKSIIVMARTQCVDREKVVGYLESSGPDVSFIELPMVLGSKNKLEYITEFHKIVKKIRNSLKNIDCGIFRVPSVMGYIALHYFMKTGKPFSLEVVINPLNAAGNEIERKIMGYYLKRVALKANGVSYVTQYYLQKLFPSYAQMYGENEQHFESYYSSINLKEEYFSCSRDYTKHDGSYRIMHVANQMNDEVKGHKIVIDVTQRLKELGYDIQTFFIGDGTKRNEFEQYANSSGLNGIIHFVGILSSAEKVREWLLKADLFLFPSKAEGLPRSLIEAMAVGLPCISTPVDGIPELLSAEYLIEPDDVEGFVNKIVYLLNNKKELNKMSEENIEKARLYEDSVLQERRDRFYGKLKDLVLQ
ncbi:MAG: glycosyltransferase family 4 protein [Butyrivibrio sp.]|nr:glycosyltransferase family 4 protein [Butyrivibrio sp.]